MTGEHGDDGRRGAVSAARPSPSRATTRRSTTGPSEVHVTEVTLEHPLDPRGLSALCVEPGGDEPVCGIVVVHDRDGLDARLRRLCARLAGTGVYVLAPDLDARHGREPGDPDAIVDLDVAIQHLRHHRRGTGRVVALGVGWGGRLALVLATSPAAPDRVVDVRGPGIARRTAIIDLGHPQVPVERVEWLNAPLLAIFVAGDEDPGEADAAELRTALALAGLEHRVVVLDEAAADLLADAPDASTDPARPSAWAEVLAWVDPLR